MIPDFGKLVKWIERYTGYRAISLVTSGALLHLAASESPHRWAPLLIRLCGDSAIPKPHCFPCLLRLRSTIQTDEAFSPSIVSRLWDVHDKVRRK